MRVGMRARAVNPPLGGQQKAGSRGDQVAANDPRFGHQHIVFNRFKHSHIIR